MKTIPNTSRQLLSFAAVTLILALSLLASGVVLLLGARCRRELNG